MGWRAGRGPACGRRPRASPAPWRLRSCAPRDRRTSRPPAQARQQPRRRSAQRTASQARQRHRLCLQVHLVCEHRGLLVQVNHLRRAGRSRWSRAGGGAWAGSSKSLLSRGGRKAAGAARRRASLQLSSSRQPTCHTASISSSSLPCSAASRSESPARRAWKVGGCRWWGRVRRGEQGTRVPAAQRQGTQQHRPGPLLEWQLPTDQPASPALPARPPAHSRSCCAAAPGWPPAPQAPPTGRPARSAAQRQQPPTAGACGGRRKVHGAACLLGVGLGWARGLLALLTHCPASCSPPGFLVDRQSGLVVALLGVCEKEEGRAGCRYGWECRRQAARMAGSHGKLTSAGTLAAQVET